MECNRSTTASSIRYFRKRHRDCLSTEILREDGIWIRFDVASAPSFIQLLAEIAEKAPDGDNESESNFICDDMELHHCHEEDSGVGGSNESSRHQSSSVAEEVNGSPRDFSRRSILASSIEAKAILQYYLAGLLKRKRPDGTTIKPNRPKTRPTWKICSYS